MVEINENIKAIRIANQWTQKEMADKLGISQNGYQKLESGDSDITWSRLNQIADVFQMPVVEIINYPNGGAVGSSEELDKLKKWNEKLRKGITIRDNLIKRQGGLIDMFVEMRKDYDRLTKVFYELRDNEIFENFLTQAALYCGTIFDLLVVAKIIENEGFMPLEHTRDYYLKYGVDDVYDFLEDNSISNAKIFELANQDGLVDFLKEKQGITIIRKEKKKRKAKKEKTSEETNAHSEEEEKL